MTTPVAAPPLVRLTGLRVGDVLAEGGEGRVHQLPRQPHLVFKSYLYPADRSHLEGLVAWPERVASVEAASTVRAAAAWPCSVVTGDDGEALGLLMPRAPRRFAVRHRDGHSRLASLSYLTSDPQHRVVAYGLSLPAAGSPERVGLIYALARLLAAFESEEPAVGHGDLSTKNVLWSLQRGPEVFVLDCDNCDVFAPDGRPAEATVRRRAMTPNWDDPAVPRGHNPIRATDLYSLGLIFLRVVGAANFPVQARQRSGDGVEIRFPVPPGPGSGLLLDPSHPVWRLCAMSLSLSQPERRPPARAWLGPLEQLLDAMGAAGLMRSVWAGQGGGEPSPDVLPAGDPNGEVSIVPEPAPRRDRTWSRVSPAPRYGGAAQPAPTASIGYRWTPTGFRPAPANPASAQAQARSPSPLATGAAPVVSPPTPRMWPELKALLLRYVGWWRSIHRARRPAGVVLFLAVDFVTLVIAAAVVALIVSPILEG